MIRRAAVSSLILAALAASSLAADGKPRKVQKTDREWARQLTPIQFAVTRQKLTEPAFNNKYFSNHARGTYRCVCCDAELFSSQAKFESGTGWPSFYKPIDDAQIDRAADNTAAEARVEVMCNDCGAHLGHVFSDGPPPTGLRYCINSASLKFVADKAAAKSGSAKGKAKAQPKAKGKAKAQPQPKSDSTEPAPEARASAHFYNDPANSAALRPRR